MIANKAVPLRYGLQARYISHKEIAALQRAQACKKAQHDEAQLELEEPQS